MIFDAESSHLRSGPPLGAQLEIVEPTEEAEASATVTESVTQEWPGVHSLTQPLAVPNRKKAEVFGSESLSIELG